MVSSNTGRAMFHRPVAANRDLKPFPNERTTGISSFTGPAAVVTASRAANWLLLTTKEQKRSTLDGSISDRSTSRIGCPITGCTSSDIAHW